MDEASQVATLVGTPDTLIDQKMGRSPGKIAMAIFGIAIAGGIIYAGIRLGSDLAQTHYPTVWPYVLLGLAL